MYTNVHNYALKINNTEGVTVSKEANYSQVDLIFPFIGTLLVFESYKELYNEILNNIMFVCFLKNPVCIKFVNVSSK